VAGQSERSCRLPKLSSASRAEWRGWTPGHELEDWLYAERKVDEMLRGGRTPE